jgi:hypothetical protein
LTNTATQIVFTGTDFFTADFTAGASFGGVDADSVTVDSATQATATWNLGLPVVTAATVPVLSFKSTVAGSTLTHFASITADVTNALSISSSTSGLSCSYAGGCVFKVQAAGFASLMKSQPDKNYITMCGNKCTFSEADSSASEAACLIPSLSTSYSVTNFKIELS